MSILLQRFVEMLRQMAIHFNVGQIQKVIYYWYNSNEIGFMLVMDNGEYWYVTSAGSKTHTFQLFKYPPPLPAISDVLISSDSIVVHTSADELNDYVSQNGGGDSLFLSLDTD